MIGKIQEFWRIVYDKYKDEADIRDEDKQILSDMCLLVLYLSPLDESNKEMIKLVSRYVETDFNSTQFIESLNILKNNGEPEKTANIIGEIFISMLENAIPTFREENIKEIISFVKKYNVLLSNSICDTYGRRGIDTFRDLWEKSN